MDQARIKTIFEALKGYSIQLPRDPAGMGPAFLRESISLCRNYLNSTSFYLQEVMEETHAATLHLEELEAVFQVQSDELRAGDKRVSTLPAVEDRSAMVNVILAEDAKKIRELKRELLNLKHIDKVVRHRKAELDNTMSTLRLQSSFLRSNLRSGQDYGDESENSRNGDIPESDLDLDALLDETAVGLATNVEEQPEAEELAEPEPEVVPKSEAEPKPKPKPVVVPEKAKAAPVKTQEELDLDAFIEAGGVDATLEEAPIPEAPKAEPSATPAKAGALKTEDVDADMQEFLDSDLGEDDDLDQLLSDI